MSTGSGMRSAVGWLIVGVFLAAATSGGCASVDRSERDGHVLEATGVAILESVDARRDPSRFWHTYLEATGEGMAAAGASTEFQQKTTALQAARSRALARLVEDLEGTEIAREAKVLNMQFAGESVSSRTRGELRGVQVITEEYNPETRVAQVTVRVGLDERGKVVPAEAVAVAPGSMDARRARAERAARVDALSRLREQIGEVRVGRSVRVRNLMLSHHEAWLSVEGIMRNVEFSEPRWRGDARCEVVASVKVPPEKLKHFRSLAESANPR
ncbi:MAG: hypothetical protein R6X33_12740 [Candidatus Brocadiia bacterium]